jgi:hypothetical protein
MDINTAAPATRDEILIHAQSGPSGTSSESRGAVRPRTSWPSASGLSTSETAGPGQNRRVMGGRPVSAQVGPLQAAPNQSLRNWMESLKRTAVSRPWVSGPALANRLSEEWRVRNMIVACPQAAPGRPFRSRLQSLRTPCPLVSNATPSSTSVEYIYEPWDTGQAKTAGCPGGGPTAHRIGQDSESGSSSANSTPDEHQASNC